ncbi:hypothetical protein [Helicobacter canis]|uniref:hypothetical protein n=1 Tax=Helicobacter canis TaxID=29419 RepID=UPI0011C057F6|nr:hypothetical protein [Helicobacter canis]
MKTPFLSSRALCQQGVAIHKSAKVDSSVKALFCHCEPTTAAGQSIFYFSHSLYLPLPHSTRIHFYPKFPHAHNPTNAPLESTFCRGCARIV